MKIQLTVSQYLALRAEPIDIDAELEHKFGLMMRTLHIARHGEPSRITVQLGSGRGACKAYGERDHDLLDMAYDILLQLGQIDVAEDEEDVDG